jgi:type IV pilus assembly protein PilY1
MNIFKFPLIALLVVPLAYADDTEIYGTNDVDSLRYGKPNVLFITDTSGSMRGSVTYDVPTAFNSATNYTNNTSIFENPNYDANWGWNLATFQTSCASVLTELETNGFATTNALQLRDGALTSLKLLTQANIECYPYQGETGYEYTLYSSDYRQWLSNNDTADRISTRMDVIKEVITNLTNNLQDVNLGLMEFNGSSGGKVDVNVADIDTSGALIREEVDDYTANGGTPLTEALHEAALYFRGDSKKYGGSGSYTSPITAECQKNHVILFTDGEPSGDEGSNTIIQGLIANTELAGITPALSKTCSGDGGCLEELAYWMRNTDHTGGDTGTNAGDHYITVHTIGGFNLSAAAGLLADTAKHGGGGFYEADDAPGIAAVVAKIFEGILESDTTFTAPAVSVNAFNASEHRDDLFYALFRPEDTIKWGGNLKKYKLSDDGIVLHAGGQTLNTGTGAAIDPTTGYFQARSYGYWNGTDVPDGSNVTNGGFANKLIASNRTVFSNTSADVLTSLQAAASYSSFGLSNNPSIAFDESDVYKWVLGYKASSTDSRFEIGDPLHSEPVIVTYGGTNEIPDSTIYFGTNEGYIHGVDTITGSEVFAFLPLEMHGIQSAYYENTLSANSKPYGMDGAITTWFKDVNNDGILLTAGTSSTVQAGEHVYLYAGMRRGGRSYYALDMSDRSNPSLLFRITGGETTGFDRLGQTWSKMTISKIKWNGADRFVLLFGGGYDTNQDTNNTRENDSVGNAVYMVDATTGDLLWSSSKNSSNLNISEMTNAIPASISAIDINGDTYIDYFYAADMGGRIFRFDINKNSTNAGNFAEGAVIAQVGDNSISGNRRFYNKPNVGLVKDKEFGDYLTISIGSGYRAHPLDDTTDERFYVIRDFDPYRQPDPYYKKTEANSTKTWLADGEIPSRDLIYNATSAMALSNPDNLATDLRSILKSGGGWYITLDSEEKVLAESLTFSNAVIFSTFLSKNGSENNCGGNTGTSKLYVLDLDNATSVIDLDGDGIKDASTTLAHSGIAPRPVVIYREGGAKTIAIGTETIEDERFEENKEECVEGQECAADDNITKCESGNCYVTPVYWRQNDNE